MHDLRQAFRALRAAPIVSIVAILSLALGVGANSAIFSILNSLLLKPLPVREPHRLVVIGSDDPNAEIWVSQVGYRVWTEMRERRLFDRPFAWATDRLALSSTGEPAFAEAIWATGDYFDVLGVPAILGRTFGERDDRRPSTLRQAQGRPEPGRGTTSSGRPEHVEGRGGGPDGPVAVISYGFWQRRFGGAADAIDRTLTIERVPFTIIGVTPPSFFGLNVGTAFDVILPLETEPLLGRVPARLESRYWPWLQIMARLAPGQTAKSLTGALRAAQPQIRQATMPDYDSVEDRDRYLRAAWTARAAPGGVSRFRRQYKPALLTLLGVVGLVLLVACANIANLLLARIAARRYEFSVRLALGASRRRLVRQLFAESLLLSAAGASIGLGLAQWGSRLLVAQLSTWAYTAVLDFSLDWRVLGITAATTVVTAVLFGTAPAVRAVRVEPIEALKRQPRGLAGDARVGLGGGLVIVQVALSLMLVVGAGLFLRSFAALAYRDLGFDRGRVVVAIVDARRSAVPPGGRAALYERVREAAAAVPGVESAATSMATPLGSAGVRFTPAITVPGSAALAGQEVRVLANPVGPDWFRTFGTRLLAGRDFEAGDRAGAARVTIVNEAFARRYFDGTSPLGQTIVEVAGPTDRRPLEIVGLVEDAAFTSVREPVEPTLYRPLAQGTDEERLASSPTISVSIRAAQQSPARLTGSLAAAMGGVDRDLSISFQTVTEQLSVFYIRERLLALLSGFFGAFALLLAALGLYGVTSHAVSRRRTEIGIRMALGANPRDVVRLVLARIAVLMSLGIAAGVIASFWATHFVATLLYGLHPRDPATLAAATLALAAVGALAGWLPARRAARIDPAQVLREG